MALRRTRKGPRAAGEERCSSRSIQIAQRNCTTGEAAAVRGSAVHTSSSEDAIYQSEVKRNGGRGGVCRQDTPPDMSIEANNKYSAIFSSFFLMSKVKGCAERAQRTKGV
jgi:hypothetical protein